MLTPHKKNPVLVPKLAAFQNASTRPDKSNDRMMITIAIYSEVAKMLRALFNANCLWETEDKLTDQFLPRYYNLL